MNKNSPYIRILRPEQWIKNILVFVPIFFAREVFSSESLLLVGLVCGAFIFASSAMYVLNDIYDREQDALHPIKRLKRPIASGSLSVVQGYQIFAFLILLIILCLLTLESLSLALPYIFAYILLNVLYSRFLKSIPVVEITTVSLFYILRVFAGGAVIGVALSSWLVLCLFFVTLLIVSAKRLSETEHEHQRKVVEKYSRGFLQAVVSLSASLSILSYALYTILASPTGTHGVMLFSIIFVTIALLRFVMIAFEYDAEFPEKKLITDHITLGAFVFWLVSVFYAFYIV